MKIVLLFLLAFFIGCSDDPEIFYNDDAYENNLQENLEHREVYGKLVFPNSFVPKSVKAFELDSSFNETEKLDVFFYSKEGTYKIKSRDYASRYLRIETAGLWKNYSSAGAEMKFELITNIAVVSDTIVLNSFSHLEIPRVKHLMEEGYPFLAAKHKAMYELFSLCQISEDLKDRLSEEFVPENEDIENFPLSLLIDGNSDSAFVENVEKFRNSFATGKKPD